MARIIGQNNYTQIQLKVWTSPYCNVLKAVIQFPQAAEGTGLK